MNHAELKKLVELIEDAFERVQVCVHAEDLWNDTDEHYDCVEDLRFVAGNINKALEGTN